ncbi:beta-propeller domain-containing protein [Brevibacillus sp. 179-C 1.1 NHS]|uniref:beta-propeller domain-containing protein n=1 Tax=Brevibacillus sp. 179-C 1.1 NHS TaxID=3235177 RepID=UPI0039A0986D
MKRTLAGLLASVMVVTTIPFLFTTGTVTEPTVQAASTEDLPVVGSYAQLKKLIQSNQDSYPYATMETTTAMPVSAPSTANKMADTSGGAVRGDFSTTNTQVQGVDEADIVKSDGTYLYQSTQNEVRIIKAYPATSMKVASRISYDNGKFIPQEMYVDDSRLIVIGQANESISYPPGTASKRGIPRYHDNSFVKTMIYDISNKQQPRLVRQLELEGYYMSSRKIGASLYVTANQYMDAYRILEEKTELPGPTYKDSSHHDEYQTIPYSDIRYFPDHFRPEYLIVAGVNLDDSKQKMSLSTYLGAGENIYASSKNLYVAVTQNNVQPVAVKQKGATTPLIAPPIESDTTIYRFAMNKGDIRYTGKGSVPGRILNQFSMDENDGYFRIATTSGNMWRDDEHTSKNNLYVLDNKLNVYGKLEGIAPGERIYSVRFMGDRAYMVTFKKVDPLFVLDLKKPSAPSVLGALKIPGYSDYLHPYDENHIIGFGKEAEADKDMAYYQGMKIALFDVSDVTKPKEKFKTVIGDRGTDSELLHNHKALLFSKDKNLLAFPVTVHERTAQQKAKNDMRDYGHFTFQGAYVYQLDLKKGFQLTDQITHLSKEDVAKAGEGWYDSTSNIKRILTIGDTLYTVSDDYVKTKQLLTPKQENILPLTK